MSGFTIPTKFLVGLIGIGLVYILGRRWLLPKPYPGIPYNKESLHRIAGDIPILNPVIEATNEFSHAAFTITTRRLGVPMAQLLLPGYRRPLIVLEDPREAEDIMIRRNKEFDRGASTVEMFAPFFQHATLGQHTTPELKAQKRLWQDVMGVDFLRRVAGPRVHKAVLELVDLWRLKANLAHKDQPFLALDDIKDSALDAMWGSAVGEESGLTQHATRKLQRQLQGDHQGAENEPAPKAAFVRVSLNYVGKTVAKYSSHPMPGWALWFETFTSRYRRYRRSVDSEIGTLMKNAVERFQLLETGQLDSGASDSCMMDLVLRRQVLEARKAGRAPEDPMKDSRVIDELFILLLAGDDSTADAMSWFLRFMESNQDCQNDLRAALKAAFPGPQPPTLEEIMQTDIPYLDATCEEGLRLAGTAKAMLRQALVDTEVLGYRIPKGAEIYFSLHVDRQPAPVDERKRSHSCQDAASKRGGDGLWGPVGRDLGAFEPKRWLSVDESGKQVFNSTALQTLAFGGGFRGCFGRRLAVMEYRMFVVLLILNFEFLPLPDGVNGWSATEEIFRHPDFPYVKLKVL